MPSTTEDDDRPLPLRERSLIVVSNRLPVSLDVREDGWQFTSSSGGLASALSGLDRSRSLSWVGWPGRVVPRHWRSEVSKALADKGLLPVFLDTKAEAHYYRGICNQVLWPLFHYFTDKVDFHPPSWRHYVQTNERFAEAVLRIAPRNAKVWVHDFHLMLLPRLLRTARPDLAIGFFLHIPFPSSEIYRILPVGEELLHGLLGSDYIGFHTHDYARHFRAACLRVLGVDSEHNAIHTDGRKIGIGAHPIGIDSDSFEEILRRQRTLELLERLGSRYEGQRLILGVERLDYTKGVLLKLQAFAHFLAKRRSPPLDLTMLQVLVPSRDECPDYRELKREIEEYVGRINGRFGGPGVTPVEYIYRSLSPEELVALYRFADVGMVTPIRDGMNLVAQEFVLCQDAAPELAHHQRGVLVLSEFAGAAQVLPRALLTNPWDIVRTAETIETALEMTLEQRRPRTSVMAEIVREMKSSAWASKFLRRFERCAEESHQPARLEKLSKPATTELIERFTRAHHRQLFLDYDGTLREIARTPEEAAPSNELLEVLRALSTLDDTETHIVSGRRREDIEEWLGHLPLHFAAEHGFAWREPDGQWTEESGVDLTWIPAVAALLQNVTDEVPGARLERKPCSLAWHYRTADLEYGSWRARELHSQLQDDLADLPVEIIHGHRVIEVRAHGINKGKYVARMLEAEDDADFVMCMGDDRTDEDMYVVLPADSVCLHVGRTAENARHFIESPEAARRLLGEMLVAVRSDQDSTTVNRG